MEQIEYLGFLRGRSQDTLPSAPLVTPLIWGQEWCGGVLEFCWCSRVSWRWFIYYLGVQENRIAV